jgi:hypothetical protein
VVRAFVVETLEREPKTAEDSSNRAACLYVLGFTETAVEDCRTILTVEPNSDRYLFELATVLWRWVRQENEALSIAEKLSQTEGDYQASALALQREILAEKDQNLPARCETVKNM